MKAFTANSRKIQDAIAREGNSPFTLTDICRSAKLKSYYVQPIIRYMVQREELKILRTFYRPRPTAVYAVKTADVTPEEIDSKIKQHLSKLDPLGWIERRYA